MNKGVLESSNSPVYHLNPNFSQPPPLMTPQPPEIYMNPNCFLIPPSQHQSTTSLLPPPTSSSSSSLLSSNPNLSSNWLEISGLYPLHHQSWSLSQLLLGGLLMEEEESMMINHDHDHDDNHHHHQNQYHHYQERKLENWEEQVLRHQTFKDVKQENNINGYVTSSPIKSCLTTTKSQRNLNITMINPSLECNRSEIGGSSYANKKLKLQVPYQSTNVKVRKEKLGGRIAALHQLVSPFGKTDTASVLSEAIGYIRFLHCQIEALSLPYFGTNSRNNIRPHHAQGDINSIFPEDPGQLENEQFMKKSKGVISSSSLENQESNPNQEQTKDLRSRGLCLLPISSTLQIGTQNGADYWNPVLGVNFQ